MEEKIEAIIKKREGNAKFNSRLMEDNPDSLVWKATKLAIEGFIDDLKHLSQEKEVEIKVKWDEWVKCPSCKTNCIRLHNYCRICWVKLKWIA